MLTCAKPASTLAPRPSLLPQERWEPGAACTQRCSAQLPAEARAQQKKPRQPLPLRAEPRQRHEAVHRDRAAATPVGEREKPRQTKVQCRGDETQGRPRGNGGAENGGGCEMGAGTGRPRVQGCGEGTAPAQGGGGFCGPREQGPALLLR